MSTTLYWLRHDLRLHDNPALALACRGADQLLPVFVHPPEGEGSPWGFARVGAHRRAFGAQALADLRANLQACGSDLLECAGPPQTVLPAIARALGAARIVCEDIAAPYEQAEVAALRAAGLAVQTVWQSSLLCPADLPFAIDALPQVFTQFRQAVERAGVQPPAPLPAPQALPPLPSGMDLGSKQAPALIQKALAAIKPEANVAPNQALAAGAADVGSKQLPAPVQKAQAAIKTGVDAAPLDDARSSFPYATPACHGGETAALAHLRQYLARKLPHSYKQTRNGLMGLDYSSKFSPWLATGALSARQVMAELRAFENQHGANDGTYWLWFELLWRDHFRFLHLQHGAALYRARGLGAAPLPPPPHNAAGFARWCQGDTGQSLVDAGMRELAATGYLSNRLRQIVASYLLHDLGGDWRAGAAWFEAQLLDYDTYSNQGNWLYVAGRGTDPRGGRRFNPDKQTHDHDADGQYRRLWGTA